MHWLSPLRLGVLSLFVFLTACGGGGGDSAPAVVQPQPDPASWLQGSAVNSPIQHAEIQLFRFDADGNEVEIVAGSTPVLTDADGDYKFWITGGSIDADTGPLIIRSTGGTMNSAAAPTLEAVVADSSSLRADGAILIQHLSVASSVAAELLRLQASAAGAAPSASDASAAVTLVEQELAVGLSQDPNDPTQPISVFAHSVDENLALEMSPDNAPAVNDYIQYLALNMSSASGALDNTMLDLATGTSVASSFNGVGTGLLASLVTDGPASFKTVHLVLDKTEIENDGMDTAFLNVSLADANGDPVADGTVVHFETTAGRLVISKNQSRTVGGKTRVNISSVWAGDAAVTVGYNGSNGAIQNAQVGLAVVNKTADVEDTIQPKVSSAGSTSNTQILVSFSEAMRGGMDSAENPAHYRVSGVDSLLTQKTGQDEVGKTGPTDQVDNKPEVRITAAELILPDRNTVRLTTLSQSDLKYEVWVVNLTDIHGNGMSAGEQFDTDPTRAEFQGMPSSGNEVVDTDGDGLSDSDEQRGWIVTTVTAAGVVLTFEVTSDPFNPDTDGDGVTDNEEFHGGLNPRTADSDGDTLTDDQEWNTIFSDGLNQDTDGDGIQDGFEYNFFHTSPILADTDGDQFSDPEEVAAGNRNPLVADLPSPRITVGEVNLQLDTRFTYVDEQGVTTESSEEVGTMLSRSENDTFSTSNEDSTKQTLESSQSLEIEYGGVFPPPGFSGKASVGFTQGSERGNTFTTSQESGKASEEAYNTSLTTSVARDIRETVTREVVDATIKIDVTIENAGTLPFTINNIEISAQSQDPRDRRRVIPIGSLVPENSGLGPINIGSLGDSSRGPFVFKTVSVFPQQVDQLMKSPRGLIMKLSNFDITDESGRNFAFISNEVVNKTAGISFDLGDGRVESYRVATASDHDSTTGVPRGITMNYALTGILGLTDMPTIRDGGNGIVETLAQGDDVQKYPLGSVLAEPGVIIITAGPNGVLDTSGLANLDDLEVEADYETTAKNGTGQRILTKFRDVKYVEDNPATPQDEGKRFWALYSSKALSAVDLDKIVLRAGDQFNFTFVQDQDMDGVWAREEALHGSSDLEGNSDSDELNDAEEIQQGWLINIRGTSPVVRVYPNPVEADSDRDGLPDHIERACGLDPRQRDTDLDGLSDFDELMGSGALSAYDRYLGAGGALADHVPLAAIDSDAAVRFGECISDPAAAVPGAFTTDPLNPDTDGDRIPDGAELEFGIDPNDPSDGAQFLDDDEDGVPNQVEIDGFLVQVNSNTQIRFVSDPLDPDSDDDGLSDLLEHYLMSNPQNSDTDGDTIRDNLEYSGATTCITKVRAPSSLPTGFCTNFRDKATNNYDDYVRDCALANVCTVYQPLGASTNTNLNERDTDFDGLLDKSEIDGVSITVELVSRQVSSDPRDSNSDDDSLYDGAERIYGTDPTQEDTDGDQTNDDVEVNMSAPARNPLRKDRRITLDYTEITFEESDCDAAADEEWYYSPGYLNPATFASGNEIVPAAWTGSYIGDTDDGAGSIKTTGSLAGDPVTFVALFDQQFALKGELVEYDGTTREDVLLWDEPYTVGIALGMGTTNYEKSGSLCGGTQKVYATVTVD